MLKDDISAWQTFPQHRLWFNKLWLSETLGYRCGPGGIPVTQPGVYVVRPIYNLRGMGLGARLKYLTPHDTHTVPPGYFWCEQFLGAQHSIDYTWNKGWQQTQAFEGCNEPDQLYRFTSWTRSSDQIELPAMLDVLQDCEHINVEFVGGKIIEVHLRVSPDPQDYHHLIPVWSDETLLMPPGYTWIASEDGADGLLPSTRLGFYVK